MPHHTFPCLATDQQMMLSLGFVWQWTAGAHRLLCTHLCGRLFSKACGSWGQSSSVNRRRQGGTWCLCCWLCARCSCLWLWTYWPLGHLAALLVATAAATTAADRAQAKHHSCVQHLATPCPLHLRPQLACTAVCCYCCCCSRALSLPMGRAAPSPCSPACPSTTALPTPRLRQL